MDPKQLTSNDVSWVHDLIAPTYTGKLDPTTVSQILDSPTSLVLGDSTVPSFLRISYYEISDAQAKLMPNWVSAGFCTQIADLSVPDNLLISLLLEGLKQALVKFPKAATQLVWASIEDQATVKLLQQKYFPTAFVEGSYIGHKTLNDAYIEGTAQIAALPI
jgi:hypothetical protein